MLILLFFKIHSLCSLSSLSSLCSSSSSTDFTLCPFVLFTRFNNKMSTVGEAEHSPIAAENITLARSQTYHFSLRTPEVKVEVADPVVSRHPELLEGVPVEHGAPAGVRRLPHHREPLLVVQGQTHVLAAQRAAWAGSGTEEV